MAPSREEAVDEGWKLLSTDRPVRFNEMEFHLPAENQFAALREVVAAIETKRPDVFFPIELRRIAHRRCLAVAVPGRASMARWPCTPITRTITTSSSP